MLLLMVSYLLNILEERISKFYNQEVPLMISTNIVENGLDLTSC